MRICKCGGIIILGETLVGEYWKFRGCGWKEFFRYERIRDQEIHKEDGGICEGGVRSGGIGVTSPSDVLER